MKKILLILSFCASHAAFGQAVWNEVNESWSNVANWTPASIPSTTSAVQINSSISGIIGLDTEASVTIASLAFNNGLSQAVVFLPFGQESIQVNGAITNNSAFLGSFSLPVTAGASATWTGPLQFSDITNIDTSQITLSNNITFSGTNLNFDITNTTIFGRFLGAGTATVSGVTIGIGGSYTGVVNDTFDLTSGNFSGATLGTLPTLGGGLTWDSSNFLTNGTLTVVPEPGTWALISVGFVCILLLRRRRTV